MAGWRRLTFPLLMVIFLLALAPSAAMPRPLRTGERGILAQDDLRFFPQTSFRVDDDAFFDYFQKRGGVRTFGYPVSRSFTLLGSRVQFFQRRVMQRQPDGRVGLLNVLDPAILNVNSINFATLPPFDPSLVASAPPSGSSPAVLDFVREHAPESFGGLPVRFFDTFISTVSCGEAFPGLPCQNALLPGLALEMWGVPNSAAAFDPNNRNFVFLRFQRGIMMFDGTSGSIIEGVLVGDALKAVIVGKHVPLDLAIQTAGSRFANQWNDERPLGLNRPAELPGTDMTNAFVPQSPSVASVELAVNAIATGLDTPWALAFAPHGRLFFTERPGRVRVIVDGQLSPNPVITLPVTETAEGGAMGLAADPNFPADPLLYVVYTYTTSNGLRNRVVRLAVEGNSAREERVLLDNIPASTIHDGGRIKVGPDGMLYVTTGDAASSSLAQDLGSLAGKLLRLNRDGTIPADNPFPGSPIFTLGHRNAEGLAWRPGSGLLYATEHGATGNDEVNLIEHGANYGWPLAQGPVHAAPFKAPLVTYSPAIAPAGATFYDGAEIPQWRGSFFFATLAGRHLHRLLFDASDPRRIAVDERLFDGEFGRLRDVVQGPDGALYLTTSNRDGRGSPAALDDRILRIGRR